MTEVRQRMIDAMVQRGFAARTQKTYVGAVRRMAKHYRRDPATYTVQEVHAQQPVQCAHSQSHQKAAPTSMGFPVLRGPPG